MKISNNVFKNNRIKKYRLILYGLIVSVVYLLIHLGTYYYRMRESFPSDMSGLSDIIFSFVNIPVFLIIGRFSHGSILVVDSEELVFMAVLGAIIYFFIGILVVMIYRKIRERKN